MAENKEKKITEFCEFVIRYVAIHGEERLTAALISRHVGVSRSWIYKYFGARKESWLEFAAEQIGRLVTVDSSVPDTDDLDKAIEVWKAGARRLLGLFEERPWIGHMYFRYMGKPDHPIGKIIERLETPFVQKSSQCFISIWKIDSLSARKAALAFAYYRMTMAHAWVENGPKRYSLSKEDWVEMLVPTPLFLLSAKLPTV